MRLLLAALVFVVSTLALSPSRNLQFIPLCFGDKNIQEENLGGLNQIEIEVESSNQPVKEQKNKTVN